MSSDPSDPVFGRQSANVGGGKVQNSIFPPVYPVHAEIFMLACSDFIRTIKPCSLTVLAKKCIYMEMLIFILLETALIVVYN